MVIGLGEFGMALTKQLSSRGMEVLAVDILQERADAAAAFANHAAAIDATDEEALSRLRPESRDIVVCAMGNSSRDAAIICTALLRQMGCKYIVSRSGNQTCGRILRLVGANGIFDLEQEYAERFALRLMYHNLLADTLPGGELELNEIYLPGFMKGKTLAELALPENYNITVAAVKRNGELRSPDIQDPFQEGDLLFVVSDEKSMIKLAQETAGK